MMQYKQLQHSNGILFVGIVLFNQFAVIIPAYGKTNIRQESALLNHWWRCHDQDEIKYKCEKIFCNRVISHVTIVRLLTDHVMISFTVGIVLCELCEIH